jgi:hypothetical protein
MAPINELKPSMKTRRSALPTQATVIRHSLKNLLIGCPRRLEIRTLLSQISSLPLGLPVKKQLPRFRRVSSRRLNLMRQGGRLVSFVSRVEIASHPLGFACL